MHEARSGSTPRVRLIYERQRTGLSQREVAEKIGTTHVNMSRWERGLTRPGPYFRRLLCDLFGKTEQELDLGASDAPIAAKTPSVSNASPPTATSTPTSLDDERFVQEQMIDIPDGISQQVRGQNGGVPLYDPLIPRRPTLELVGRDAELAMLRERLCGGQNVALTALNGLPGVGKTALSLALVQDAEVRRYFRDGILWAGLGPNPNLSSMLSRWGKLLDVGMADMNSNEERARALRAALGTRRMLIVIDDAWTVEQALLFKVGGPDCVHLITTRFPVIATHFAPDSAINISELGSEDSMRLLSTLAPEVVQEEVTRAQELVSAVGGLPLALTLIGNYLRKQAYSRQKRRINTALDRLSHAHERLLLSEEQDTTDGHSSLEPDVSLSLQSIFSVTDHQLKAETRHALYALSVFPAKPYSFSERAALHVANCEVESLDLLSDTGLLESMGDGRYTLHQTIADYARLHLRDVDGAYERFLDYITSALEQREKDYDLLERESQLIYAALDASYTRGRGEYLIRAVLAFTPYLLSRGLYPQAKEWLERAYEAAEQRGIEEYIIRALLYLSRVAEKQGDSALAEKYSQSGLTLAREVNAHESICLLLTDLGRITWKRGEFSKAREYLQEGLPLAQSIGKPEYLSTILEILGSVEARECNYILSEQYLKEGLVYAREVGEREQLYLTFTNLGVTLGEQGRYTEARQYLKEGLEIARQIGHREWTCAALSNLGNLSIEQEQFVQAERHLKEGIVLARQVGRREWICILLLNLGLVTRKLKSFLQSEEYLRESLVVARQIGVPQITANCLYEYGNLYLDLQQFERAEEIFNDMLSITPDKSQDLIALAQYGLAQALAAQGRNNEARRLGEESTTMLTAIGHRNAVEVKDWLRTLVMRDTSSTK